jgi:RNA polymerase sigma factor (sigma-70 family)
MTRDVGARDEEDGFDAAFRELFRPAFRVAYRLLGNVTDAEDAAAEALARACVAWRRVGKLPYRDAWVMRVSANVAVDIVRRRRAPAPASPPVEDDADATVRRLAMVEVLRRLPRRQREAVALRYLAGLSEADTAAALQVSVNTVKTHTLRGLAALRASLGAETIEVDRVLD